MKKLHILILQKEKEHFEQIHTQLNQIYPNAQIDWVNSIEEIVEKVKYGNIPDVIVRGPYDDIFYEIMNQMPFGVYRTTPDGKILYVNQKLVDIVGASSIEEMLSWNLEQEDSPIRINREEFKRSLENAETIQGREFRWITKDNRVLFIRENARCVKDENGKTMYYEGIVEDVTKQRVEQDRQFHKQRINSLILLANGIVSDLNAVLSPIFLATQLLRYKSLDEDSKSLINSIENHLEKCIQILKQLSLSPTISKYETAPVSIDAILKEIQRLAEVMFPKNIILQIQKPNTLPMVLGEYSRLYQAFVQTISVIANSMGKGGTIKIIITMEEGKKIRCEIDGQNAVLPNDILNTKLDTFFSIPYLHNPYGIGLANAKEIFESYNGSIQLIRCGGEGTNLLILLPIVEPKETKTKETISVSNQFLGNKELILVVDDDKEITSIMKSLLENHNYQVLVASDGTQALQIFAAHQKEIKLVISDIMMPNLDGAMLLQALLEREPNLKCIAISGLIHKVENEKDLVEKGVKFLSKPFSFKLLLQLIQASLNES